MQTTSDVVCNECGFVFKGHQNLHGKICTRCGNFMSAQFELPIVIQNRMAMKSLKRKLWKYLASKLNGGNNADFNR